jgi:pimeloyl-ACP methyl ester carboxylesterase
MDLGVWRKLPWPAKVALPAFVLLSGLSGLVGAAAALPTRLEPLAAQAPAFAQPLQTKRTGHAACGLNQRKLGDGCATLRLTAWHEQAVSFPAGEAGTPPARLQGTLTLPRGVDGKRPAAVLIHGSGPSDRHGETRGGLMVHHEPFRLLDALAHELARNGIVSLRYDKRSCLRCYPGTPFDAAAFRFSHFEDDALAALRFVASRPEVDASALLLVGHSQGGQLAPFVAKRYGQLRAVVMLAGPTDTLEHGLLGQFDRLAAARRAQYDWFGAWQADKTRAGYARCFARLRSSFQPLEQCVGGGVTQQALGAHVIRGALTTERLRTLSCPLLVLHGNLDRNVRPSTARQLAALLPPNRAGVHLLHGVGHSLTHGIEPDDPVSLAPSVTAALRRFFSTVTR